MIPLAVCLVAAAVEGLAAGPGVKRRLESLRQPRWAPSFGVWVLIGGLYYFLCFVLLFRLIGLAPSLLRTSALVLTGILMLVNAAFNFVFFRRAALRASLLLFLPYSAVALAVLGMLLRLDRVTAVIFGLYLVYLVYATVWGYQTCRPNRTGLRDS